MAAFQHGANTALLHDASTLNSRKSILLVSCVSISFPRKPTRRKNHLRQKIQKTLTKPTFPKLPQENPVNLYDSPPLEEVQEAEKSVNSDVANEITRSGEESREVEFSVSHGLGNDKSAVVWAKESIFKYGFWLVGAFVFQTVCAVWFFSKNEVLNGYDGKSSAIELGDDVEGKSRLRVFMNGNGVDGGTGAFVYVDELEMERKIEEIRALAREAREKERNSRKSFDGGQSDDNDVEKYSKSVIEEEVDGKLVKLRKKLEKPHASSLENPRKEKKAMKKVSNGELDVGEVNDALLFKKKYKYKGLDGDPIEKPKGFGSDDITVNKGAESESLIKGDTEKPLESSTSDPERKETIRVVEEEKGKGNIEAKESTKNAKKMLPKERGARKQRHGQDVAKSKVIDGTNMDKLNETRGTEALKSKKPSAEALKSQGTSTVASEMVRNKMRIKNDQSGGPGNEADAWWLNLPYVLAILMGRGQNGEDGEGLYTLKSMPSAEDHLPHVVAFEDRADAHNFCYLLQSFFEDLEDFNAQVVPLTAEELKSAAKTYSTRAIVVKRGQLKLYAGQPLADAEMAMRGIIKRG